MGRKPLLSELTLREKIGQTALGRAMNTDLLDLKKYPYGFIWTLGNIEMGVINMDDKAGKEVTNRKKWLSFLKEMSAQTKVPVVAGMDCMRGIMASFSEFPPIMDPVTMGATNDEEIAYEAGRLRADHLKLVGTNWLWSPEVDLPNRMSMISLGRRYSDDPERLMRMAIADMKGIQSKRCAATAKHFPGADGLEYRDSHTSQTMLLLSYDEWMAYQGKYFKQMIDAGVDSIMVAHRAFPGCDDSKVNGKYRPATISYKMVTEVLKGEFGFGGVVITDGITMKGLINMFDGDMNRVYVEAIKAGNDVVLGVLDGYFEAIEEAVLSGEIPESRIDDACQRVLDLKEKLGVFEDDYEIAWENDAQFEDCVRRTEAFNKKVAERALSLVCDKHKVLPVSRDKIRNVAIIYTGYHDEPYENLKYMAAAFEERGAKVHIQRSFEDNYKWEEIQKLDAENDLLIYAGHIMRGCGGLPTFRGKEVWVFEKALVAGAEKSVAIGLGSPFMYFDFFINFPAFINAYNHTQFTMEALVAAMYGEIPFAGSEPYELYPPQMKPYLERYGLI